MVICAMTLDLALEAAVTIFNLSLYAVQHYTLNGGYEWSDNLSNLENKCFYTLLSQLTLPAWQSFIFYVILKESVLTDPFENLKHIKQ
jgi:hypothetical protein